jgi:hypothetical protein
MGIIAVPRDWTDKGDPDPYALLSRPSPVLSFIHLEQLVDLVNALTLTTVDKK